MQVWIEQEPGSAGKIVVDHYVRSVLPGYALRAERSSGSKVVRADPVSSQAEAGNVSIVDGPWLESLRLGIGAVPERDDTTIRSTRSRWRSRCLADDGASVHAHDYRGDTYQEPVTRRGDLILRGEQYIDRD